VNEIFKDKIIIVAGGASGIGREIVRQLAINDAKIVIVDRDLENGTSLQAELEEYTVAFQQSDMTNASEVEKLFDSVFQEYGRIDYVFNSAGNFMGGEIRDTPLENWQAVIQNNIWAVYNGTHYAYQIMLIQKYGHIINFASAAGLFPVPGMGIYGSTKFAIVGLSEALRHEAKSLGIKVSTVCPTVVDTPLYDTAIYNKVNIQKALKKRSKLQTPEFAAQRVLKGVSKNRAIIHTAGSTRIGWWIYKFAPWLYDISAQRIIGMYRKNFRMVDK